MKFVYYVRFDTLVTLERPDYPQYKFNAHGVNVVAGSMGEALEMAKRAYPDHPIKSVERTCHVGGLPVLLE
jgi:hypothetical protein